MTSFGRRIASLAALSSILVGGAFAAPAIAESKLERDVLQNVRAAGFGDVIDSDRPLPGPNPPWFAPIASTPQVDVAVLELNPAGRVTDAANILMSRDYPNGVVVPIGSKLDSSAVRYRKWDLDRWDGTNGKTWTASYSDGEDIVAGRERAPIEFMTPYPASALKLMVAYGIMRLVDQGKVNLDAPLTYAPAPANCYGTGGTKTVREWMRIMIVQSDNEATCALISDLHARGEMGPLNDHFVASGLPSLSLRGTRPSDGGGWSAGRGVFMGGLDTVKLLWLIDGAPGTLWKTPAGRSIKADELSGASRAFLKQLLAGQGFNEVLATTNWCGATLGPQFPTPERVYPAPGIPTATPANFILPDGTVEVEGVPYFQQVGPCNAAAEVVFSHKTGLVRNAGADVGFVHSLPGKRRRDYVIAVFTNLGNRFGDSIMNTSAVDPINFDCWSENAVCYSEAFAKLGRGIDGAVGKRK